MRQKIIISFTCTCLYLFSVIALSAFERIRLDGELKGNFETPCDVAVSENGSIYVLDSRGSRVAVFGPDRKQKYLFGKRGSKSGELSRPQALAIIPGGRVAVADSGNNRIQVFEPDGKPAFSFGESGSGKGAFRDPSGVAVDHFGFFFVADTGNERVSVFGPGGGFLMHWKTPERPTDIEVDPERNVYVLMPRSRKIIQYSSQGEKRGEFSCVSGTRDRYSDNGGIAVDRRGDICITGNEEGNIRKISQDQKILLSFGSEGAGRGQFDEPAGIASDTAGRIYVADSGNSRVQIFSASGSTKEKLAFARTSPPFLELKKIIKARKDISGLVSHPDNGLYTLSSQAKTPIILYRGNAQSVYGKTGRKPGEFSSPMAINISASRKLFVADTRNSRIQVLDLNGKFQFEFGDHGSKKGQFNRPEGIVSTPSAVYVADTGNNRIQIFSPDGIFFRSFEGNRDKDRELRSPGALAVDSKKQLYVLDAGNHRVQVFSAEGTFIRVIGKEGQGPGQFRNPIDLAIDGKDCLYVADQGNARIQVFDAGGNFLSAAGCAGESQGAFESLSAIEVKGNAVYAADSEKDFIQIFHYHRNGLTHSTIEESRKPDTEPEKSEPKKPSVKPQRKEPSSVSQPEFSNKPTKPEPKPAAEITAPKKAAPETAASKPVDAPKPVAKPIQPQKAKKKKEPSSVSETNHHSETKNTQPGPVEPAPTATTAQPTEPSSDHAEAAKPEPGPKAKKEPVEIPPLLTVPDKKKKTEKTPAPALEKKKTPKKRFTFDREFKE